ncbi:MAG: peptide-methionine (S)-S-oxide reductase MsrA [Pseudomonadales bacterium]
MHILPKLLANSLTSTIALVLFLTACAEPEVTAAEQNTQATDNGQHATAIFAGGCFWCMEKPFDILEGVISTTSGYTGSDWENPTYKQVSAGKTGHTEAVKIIYDPDKISYEKLLAVFWRNIDPLTANRQFCDQGSQYRSGIFYTDEAQRLLAEQSKTQVAQKFKQELATELVAASTFYPAEDYHQDYYIKNPLRYKYYRNGCGRDKRLKQLWGAEAGG